MKVANKTMNLGININSLELVSPPRMDSVVVSAKDYAGCLPEFERLAKCDGARFRCALGACELALSLHDDSANIILLRNARQGVGRARLIWSEYALNGVRNTSFLRGHVMSDKNIACLIVDLANAFRTTASAEDVNAAIHAFAGAAFGVLKRIANGPAINSYEGSLSIPTTAISSRLLAKNTVDDVEL